MQESQNNIEYKTLRLTQFPELCEYPHHWKITNNIHNIIRNYDHINAGDRLHTTEESIIGRIMQKRSAGKKLHFYTILTDGVLFQIMTDIKSFHDPDVFKHVNKLSARGDIIGVRGYIAKTRKGELSIVPKYMKILTPCFATLPHSHYGVVDKELRYRYRYVDLVVNTNIRDIFITRHKIINYSMLCLK